jgi:hypothetical protein
MEQDGGDDSLASFDADDERTEAGYSSAANFGGATSSSALANNPMHATIIVAIIMALLMDGNRPTFLDDIIIKQSYNSLLLCTLVTHRMKSKVEKLQGSEDSSARCAAIPAPVDIRCVPGRYIWSRRKMSNRQYR